MRNKDVASRLQIQGTLADSILWCVKRMFRDIVLLIGGLLLTIITYALLTITLTEYAYVLSSLVTLTATVVILMVILKNVKWLKTALSILFKDKKLMVYSTDYIEIPQHIREHKT